MKRSGMGTAISTARAIGGAIIETLRRAYGSLFYNEGPYG